MLEKILRKIILTGLFFVALAINEATAEGAWYSGSPEFPVIIYDGPIKSDSYSEFITMLEKHPNTTSVVLNSVGGNVIAALNIARKIDQLGLSTFVIEDGVCYSACSFIFFAGHWRRAFGEIGVHQISGTSDIGLTQSVVAEIYESLLEFGVDDKVLSAMFKTASDDMYIFNAHEISEFRINRDSKEPTKKRPPTDKLVPLEIITSTRNGRWETLLLRNEEDGHYLCAIQSTSQGVTVRLARYMTRSSTFLEVLDPTVPFTAGSNPIEIEFRKKNEDPMSVTTKAFADEPSAVVANLKDFDFAALMAFIARSHTMSIQANTRLIGLFDLTGSLKSMQAFSRCMNN